MRGAPAASRPRRAGARARLRPQHLRRLVARRGLRRAGQALRRLPRGGRDPALPGAIAPVRGPRPPAARRPTEASLEKPLAYWREPPRRRPGRARPPHRPPAAAAAELPRPNAANASVERARRRRSRLRARRAGDALRHPARGVRRPPVPRQRAGDGRRRLDVGRARPAATCRRASACSRARSRSAPTSTADRRSASWWPMSGGRCSRPLRTRTRRSNGSSPSSSPNGTRAVTRSSRCSSRTFRYATLALEGSEPFDASPSTSRFDLTLWVEEEVEGIDLVWEYATDLFDDATVERLESQFLFLLDAALADPERPVAALPLVGEAGRRELFARWPGSDVDFPVACLHELFEQQRRGRRGCRRRPVRRGDAVATGS